MKDKIVDYLIKKYDPEAIITYGSFANNTADNDSDFDALILANSNERYDNSVVLGVDLDVYISPCEIDFNNIDMEEYIQIHDGVIEFDKNGVAHKLKNVVLEYLNNFTFRPKEEIYKDVLWCRKMLTRTKRDDAEGYFRWHWLLVDSLEIYFDIIREKYWGPKKAMSRLIEIDFTAYTKYVTALKELNYEALKSWISYMEECYVSNFSAEES